VLVQRVGESLGHGQAKNGVEDAADTALADLDDVLHKASVVPVGESIRNQAGSRTHLLSCHTILCPGTASTRIPFHLSRLGAHILVHPHHIADMTGRGDKQVELRVGTGHHAWYRSSAGFSRK
jgi:hypothetical protein